MDILVRVRFGRDPTLPQSELGGKGLGSCWPTSPPHFIDEQAESERPDQLRLFTSPPNPRQLSNYGHIPRGRQNNCPKHVLILIPWTCEYVTLNSKRDFAAVIRLGIWRWGTHPDSWGGQCHHSHPEEGKREAGDSGQRLEDAMLRGLTMVEVATSHGVWAGCRSWKRKGTGVFPRELHRSTAPRPWF